MRSANLLAENSDPRHPDRPRRHGARPSTSGSIRCGWCTGGMILSMAVLSFTGYYIHDPFIVGQINHPFLMGWFRFAHEAFGDGVHRPVSAAHVPVLRGNRWVGWRQLCPLHAQQFKEMLEVTKFYLFINPKPVSKIGHNAMAALSYLGLYALLLVEIMTGLVMYNWLRHSAILGSLVGWIPA